MREQRHLYLPTPSSASERRSSRTYGRYFANNHYSPLLLLTLLLAYTPLATKAQSCALYDPPVPGINCFHGDQVLRSITNSRTSWMIELYSSWCGHCQHFAPAMKELGKDVKQWSSVVRIGVLECTESKENQEICSKFNIGGYPTVRFFHPNDPNPLEYNNKVVGSRSIDVMRRLIVDHVASLSDNKPSGWPHFKPLQDSSILSIAPADWKPTVLIFESDSSYVGRELILDMASSKNLVVHRVSTANAALSRHYSILETPSMVIEMDKDHFHIVDGHSFENPRKEFRQALIDHLHYIKEERQNKKKNKHLTSLSHPSPPPPPPPPPSSAKIVNRPSLFNKQTNTTVKEENREIGLQRAPHPVHPPHPPAIAPIPVRINRVNRGDLLGAVSYALRREVTIHSIISGSAYSALYRFIHLLESAFRESLPLASESLQQVRLKLESRASTGFIINRDWQRILDTRLNKTLFPENPTWTNCNGSLPRYRGYPCSLWMLMHTVTILSLPTHTPHSLTFTSKEALTILAGFVRNFFSCEFCRRHFVEMAITISQGGITHDGDAVLWLWEAHNVVNKRLKGSISSDPVYPKIMFPSYKVCPFCYELVQDTVSASVMESAKMTTSTRVLPSFNDTSFSRGESLVAAYMTDNKKEASTAANKTAESAAHVWNRTAVLLYLWNFYHLPAGGNFSSPRHHTLHHISPQTVLHAAWPKQYKDVERLHHKFYGLGGGGMHYGDYSGLGFNHIDTGLCLMSYVMCVLFLATIAYLLVRRRRLRRLFIY